MTAKSATWRPPMWLTGVLDQTQSRKEAAADELVRSVWPHAFRIAFSILRDRGLAEDTAQEACAVVFRAVSDLRSAQAFNVWFYRIVVRKALSIRKRHAPCVQLPELNEPALCESIQTDLKVDILSALSRITPRQRAVVALYYYARMTSREIGAILGIPESTVRSHIMKAKRLLEELLAGHGECRSDGGDE